MFIINVYARGGSNRTYSANTPEGEAALRGNLKRNTNMNNRQIGQAVRRARNANANIMGNRRG